MEIKFRKKDLVKTMRRIDTVYARLVEQLGKGRAQKLPLMNQGSFCPAICSCLQQAVGLCWEGFPPQPCLNTVPRSVCVVAGTEHSTAPSQTWGSAAGLWAGL